MIANLLRGLLIGTAEVIPGVSGGTIALIVGIYERIISSANHAVQAFVFVLRGKFQQAKQEIKEMECSSQSLPRQQHWSRFSSRNLRSCGVYLRGSSPPQ